MPTHRLERNSPALDKGDCGNCASDQRGFSRPVDLPSIANVSDASDIGSFELQSSELDSTPPVITPIVTGTLGNKGWYTSNVQVSWSVVDDETFISNQTGCATQTVSTDTSGVTFTCSATSLGGTSLQSVTVKRDATAPTITFFSRTTPNANGWNTTNVAVQWNCADSLSGVISPTVSNIVSAEGANLSTTGICTDNAGNTASNTQTGIKIDKTAPVVNFSSRTPAPNAAGWNNTNVTVNWNCSDATSGAVNPTVSQTLTTEGANLSATGTCTDLAGNSASNTQSGIKIDKTAPVIVFASRTAPNAAGWNNTNVTVNWNCGDALSGATSTTVSQTLSAEGASLSATGTCFDVAGNSNSNTQTGIKIDKTAPTLAPSVAPNPVILNASATASANPSDALSGIASASCAPVVTSSVGFKTLICTATDATGNTASTNANYQVIYNFAGFFSPVQNLPSTNLVSAGQIIDVYFSLTGNQGLSLIAAGYPASVQIPCNATVPGANLEPTNGFGRNAFNYNSATDCYLYQWATSIGWAGTCRMFVLKLVDGTEHYARFQFQ